MIEDGTAADQRLALGEVGLYYPVWIQIKVEPAAVSDPVPGLTVVIGGGTAG